MKNDTASTFFEILLFCVSFFILCAIIVILSVHDTETVVKDLSTEFVDLCRTTGSVNPMEYQAFVSQMSAVGDYTVEIMHEPKQYYISDYNNAKNVDTSYYYHDSDDIMNAMFTEVGDDIPYRMKNGDRFTIQVRRGAGNPLVSLTKSFLGYDISNYVIVHYGGQVGYSG